MSKLSWAEVYTLFLLIAFLIAVVALMTNSGIILTAAIIVGTLFAFLAAVAFWFKV
jgi:hypothetical protein